ncbi:MAG: LysM peptidoglycan-binding domain-containing protein [Maritimibacter sp.]
MTKLMQGWAGWLLGGAVLVAIFLVSVWGLMSEQTDGEVAQSDTADVERPAPIVAGDTPNGAPVEAQEKTTEPPVQREQPEQPEQTDRADGPQEALKAPEFDVVRITPDGNAVIAGFAAPGATLRILAGGQIVHETLADAGGNFVALFDMPEGEEGRDLWLEMDVAGEVTTSAQTLLVEPVAQQSAAASLEDGFEDGAQDGTQEVEVSQQPKLVLAGPEGAKVVQDAPPLANQQDNEGGPVIAPLSLDSIAYSDAGGVALAGRSSGAVQVYLDGAPIGLAPEAVGQWHLPLPEDVQAGVYTLRLDEVTPQGEVTARVETPFKREEAAVLQAAALAANLGEDGKRAAAITVQHGATLWAISEARYGDGLRYVQVFAANRDLIRDPDLIYPGQVFSLPE